MPTITGRTPHIHWDERGEGTPILLVMGHLYTGRMWAPIVDGLAEHHRVLWFDNRGTGQSGWTRDATVADLASDAWAVMDAAGVEAAHIMGASQGGVVVLEMAMSRPDRVRSLIVGCSGALTPDFRTRSRKATFMDWLVHQTPPWVIHRAGRKAAAEGSSKGYGSACPAERIAANRELMLGETWNRRGVWAQSKALAKYSTTLDDVAKVQTPTLVIHGTEDQAVPYAKAVELDATLPDSRLVTYEGVAHNFVAEVPDRTVADLTAFLAEVDARSSATDLAE